MAMAVVPQGMQQPTRQPLKLRPHTHASLLFGLDVYHASHDTTALKHIDFYAIRIVLVHLALPPGRGGGEGDGGP